MTSACDVWIDGLGFAEGPPWHDGRLWYSDFFDHTVWSVADDGSSPRAEAVVAGQPSGIGWMPDDRLLVVSMLDRAVVRREVDGTLARHADLSAVATWHANDMLVDRLGRAFVGNFGFDLDGFFEKRVAPSTASLARVDPDGSVREAASELAFPNGMVLLEDAKTLVVAETMGERLTAFTVGSDGSLADRRLWAQLPGCAPDGICADAEGAIWVANAFSTECIRVVEGGGISERVTTSKRCFACALGGPDGRSLFCMTAPHSHFARLAGRREGRIERAPVRVAAT